ncbi:hypothetical protein [Paenibacillus dakarensis]|uniref:hypothetical protein n=1 Tax=Paenibacillus dakarensis TaxID=1527293 RepID=UPI0006D538F2|nr:hypothetical protein [Paenibacillus dakarensis]
MDIQELVRKIGILQELISNIDPSVQVSFEIINGILQISIMSSFGEALMLEFENFNKDYKTSSDGFLVSESFFIVLKEIKKIKTGEKYIATLMEFLNDALAIVILIPDESYNKIDQIIIDTMSKQYYPDGPVKYDDITYEVFSSANV